MSENAELLPGQDIGQDEVLPTDVIVGKLVGSENPNSKRSFKWFKGKLLLRCPSLLLVGRNGRWKANLKME